MQSCRPSPTSDTRRACQPAPVWWLPVRDRPAYPRTREPGSLSSCHLHGEGNINFFPCKHTQFCGKKQWLQIDGATRAVLAWWESPLPNVCHTRAVREKVTYSLSQIVIKPVTSSHPGDTIS